MDKITKGYVNRFDRIKFTQLLPSGRRIYEEYIRQDRNCRRNTR